MTCPNTGKEQFATPTGAYKRIRMLERRKKDRHDDKFSHGPLTAYKCRYCDQWHFGHSTPKRNNRRPMEAFA